jgi:hypothetical protein
MLQPADPSQPAARPRFPALDPEPPRRPWRIARPVLALIVVAATVGLGYVALSTGRHRKDPIPVSLASPFSGTVLGESAAGVLTLTDLRTGNAKSLISQGEFGTDPPPVLSPDGKYFFDQATGKTLSLADPLHPLAVQNSLNLQPGAASYLASPWTGDDADMIVMGLRPIHRGCPPLSPTLRCRHCRPATPSHWDLPTMQPGIRSMLARSSAFPPMPSHLLTASSPTRVLSCATREHLHTCWPPWPH